jgi:hypothetical protein
MNGVLIHTSTDPYGRDNYVLDLTPSTSSFADGALAVGRSYNDPSANVTITPLSVSSSGASVSVAFGAQPCVAANPSIVVSPSATQWVAPGSTLTYQVSLTNNDNGCASSSFNLQASVPAGWIGAFDNPEVMLSSGASTTVNLFVTSPGSALDGYYNIGVAGTNMNNSNYSVSASVTCSIMSGLAVSVTSDRASYTRSQTATVTANVSSAGSVVSGATVSFTMTKANGSKVTSTATTGANGSAVFRYRFNKKDPVGIYQVSAIANLNGVMGSGGISFNVQ